MMGFKFIYTPYYPEAQNTRVLENKTLGSSTRLATFKNHLTGAFKIMVSVESAGTL